MEKDTLIKELLLLCDRPQGINSWHDIAIFLSYLPKGQLRSEMCLLVEKRVQNWNNDFRLIDTVANYPPEIRQLCRRLHYYRRENAYISPSLEVREVQPFTRLDILLCENVRFNEHFFNENLWPNLNSLHIHQSGIEDKDWEKLIDSGLLSRLKSLTISHVDIASSPDFLSLILSQQTDLLESLTVSSVNLKLKHINLIARMQSKFLKKLNISKNGNFDAKGLDKLIQADFWMNLQELNIFKTGVSVNQITELKLSGNCSLDLKLVNDIAVNNLFW